MASLIILHCWIFLQNISKSFPSSYRVPHPCPRRWPRPGKSLWSIRWLNNSEDNKKSELWIMNQFWIEKSPRCELVQAKCGNVLKRLTGWANWSASKFSKPSPFPHCIHWYETEICPVPNVILLSKGVDLAMFMLESEKKTTNWWRLRWGDLCFPFWLMW